MDPAGPAKTENHKFHRLKHEHNQKRYHTAASGIPMYGQYGRNLFRKRRLLPVLQRTENPDNGKSPGRTETGKVSRLRRIRKYLSGSNRKVESFFRVQSGQKNTISLKMNKCYILNIMLIIGQ